MLRISSNNERQGSGLSRREWLRVGGLSWMGASLSFANQASGKAAANLGPQFGKAKSCIFIFLSGGHPQHETFDPKPLAASALRGPFKPIHTNVPGIDFCELMPRTARVADRLCILRSLATDDNTHGSSAYYYYTGTNHVKGGLPLGKTDRKADRMIDWPSIASVVGKLKPSERSPFSSALLPELLLNNPGYLFAGQDGGFMGRGWDPQVFQCDPTKPNYQIDSLGLANDISKVRLTRRRNLRESLNDHFDRLQSSNVVGTFSRHVRQAFDVLMSGPARAAFNLAKENNPLRDLYGRNKFGQSLLLARRLVEAGVRFVQVNWPREPGDLSVGNPAWDTHFDNAGRCRDTLCPPFDLGLATLITDLEQRGLLDETLVVVLGDFGRTPKINANGGRDHWGPVMSGVLAGAGVSSGQVVGASDRNGSYPTDRRIEPQELSATIFHLLGIDPQTHIEVAGRPFKITSGRVIPEVLGQGKVTGKRRPATGVVGPLPDFNRGPISNGQFATGSRTKSKFGTARFWQSLPQWDASRANDFSCVSRFALGDDVYAAQIGYGLGSEQPRNIPKSAKAMLAQEIYNPRPGTYTLTVRVSASGDKISEPLWQRHLQCRIVLFRFTDLSRDFNKISVLAETRFTPMFDADPVDVEVGRLMKDQQGGSGELLKGIGVAVIVENKSPQPLDLVKLKAKRAALRIHRATVSFEPRR